MRIQLIIFAWFLSNTFIVYGQSISSKAVEDFSDAISIQVHDIFQKVPISETKQVEIANLLQDNQSKIADLIRNNGSVDEIEQMKETLQSQINSVLSDKERYELYVANLKSKAKHKYTYSLFAIAYRYKADIGLSNTQIDEVLNEIMVLKDMKNKHYNEHAKSLDTRAYESEKISDLLTESQLQQVLEYKNLRKAEGAAKKDWEELVERGFSDHFEQNNAIAELEQYYLQRFNAFTRYEHDVIKQKIETKQVFEDRPVSLKLLHRARRNPDNDTLLDNFEW